MRKQKTTFIYMGDPQCSRLSGEESDYSGWAKLLAKARAAEQQILNEFRSDETGKTEETQRLLVLGGDIVNRRNREEEWTAFLKAYDYAAEPRDKDILTSPVNGSVESIGRHKDRFLNTGNGPAGYEKNFFSFDYGCCHFIVLDSEFMGNTSRDAYKYIGNWIKADLFTNTRPVVMAVMHHPMYTIGTSFEDDVRAKAMQDNYMKLLYSCGVDFILCGHQHVYCRTKPMEPPMIPQIMGVSGTKYFDAWDVGKMEIIKENVSVATIFETDGETIKLKSIDSEGHLIDEHAKSVHPPKKKHCTTCANYAKCGGTGEYERLESEKKAVLHGNPLKPSNKEGIVVKWGDGSRTDFVSNEKIKTLETMEVVYSVMRGKRLIHESFRGFRLEDLLEAAGVKLPRDGECQETDFALVLTPENGRQRFLRLKEILTANCYEEAASGGHVIRWIVPAIMFEEDGGYRIAYGQMYPGQYNGRLWARNIREVEIRNVCLTTLKQGI